MRASCWSMPVGLGLLLLLVTGCDGLDLPIALSAPTDSAHSSEVNRGTPGAGPSRSADMESIGPEAAKRIYYQFIDDRGGVQFVERLSDVPSAWREQVGYVEMSQPPPLTPQEARKTWQVSTSRATEIMLASATTGGRPARLRRPGPRPSDRTARRTSCTPPQRSPPCLRCSFSNPARLRREAPFYHQLGRAFQK